MNQRFPEPIASYILATIQCPSLVRGIIPSEVFHSSLSERKHVRTIAAEINSPFDESSESIILDGSADAHVMGFMGPQYLLNPVFFRNTMGCCNSDDFTNALIDTYFPQFWNEARSG